MARRLFCRFAGRSFTTASRQSKRAWVLGGSITAATLLTGSQTVFAAPFSAGNIFTWGSSQYGQLGHGDQVNVPRPQVVDTVDGEKVIQISAGMDNMAALTEEGKLYTWGRGQYKVLGHGDNSTVNTPKLVDCDCKFKYVDVSGTHGLAIDDEGKVWSWGMSGDGALGRGGAGSSPELVEGLDGIKIKSVASGRSHSLAVAEDGRLFVWGGNREGALGLGGRTSHDRPVEVKTLDDRKVRQVSAGSGFTLILTEQGHVFTCGMSDFGQTGIGSSADRYIRVPTQIRSLRNKEVVHVDAGVYHAACVTAGGEVYVWGLGQDGQIGIGSRALHNTVPQLVPGLSNVRSVSCGGGHTAALTEEGEVYVWGRGRDGQIGRANHTESIAAVRDSPVKLDQFCSDKLKVKSVALGNNFSTALI